MGAGDKLLAVISILEGRGFPKRPRHKIIVEAKFDGELLATDAVHHSETFDVNQELAWELDRKALQQHRLQRSSIKIQCYAYDNHTTMKESVGYVILDLRSAAPNKQVPKWYLLLNSKYHKTKAEIRMALYLDEEASGKTETEAQQTSAKPTFKGFDMKSLVPVLDEAGGFYQIGPAASCSEKFVISVTIAYANNLTHLIPSSMPLPASGGFFFYYSLLGNDVTNEPFFDLVHPNFPAERASVKVRSSVDALGSFLSHQPGLQLHVCSGDQSLGSCDIPLSGLLKKDSTEIYMRPVTVEGSFPLIPTNKSPQQMAALPPTTLPCVGASVVLRKEDLAMKSPTRENLNAAVVTGAPSTEDEKEKSAAQKKDFSENLKKKATDAADRDGSNHKGGDNYSEDSFEEDSKASAAAVADNPTAAKIGASQQQQQDQQREWYGKQADLQAHHQHHRQQQQQQQQQQHQQQQRNQTNAAPQQVYVVNSQADMIHNPAVPPQAHHFTFSVDLRSIRDNQSTNTINIFLRYMYPFFGSAAPILTHPPVEIRKGSEVLLPQSFCAFDFACTVQQLQDTFVRVPLVVEVWHRDRHLSQDVLIGTAKLPLSSVISTDRTRMMSSTGVTGWRQETSDRVPVLSATGNQSKCADISLVLSLEDWGPITSSSNQPALSQQHQPPTSTVSGAAGQHQPAARPRAGNDGAGASSPRGSSEYQVAVELELWKEEKEKEFEKQLKLKESTYMKALAEEWKKRDTEREVLTQKKLTEYKQMEDQLRKTLNDLEKREKKLLVNEQEVMKLRTDLQREHDRKLEEMKEASRRMKQDCDHQVELQRMKSKELEDITERYKREVAEGLKKYRALENEFSTYKEQQMKTPEVRLQSELNLLNMEKIELERKLEAATKSKLHYKQQWGRALREVATLKQREQEVAKAHLVRQQQELEQMRLRYMAAEEKEIVSKESKELEEIKEQINKLKQMEEERLRNTSDSNPLPSVRDAYGKALNMGLDSSVDEHITRLVEERDTLLRTGVYTTQDKIIAELDRQIREAIGCRDT
ncbi:centrosomal protein of 120 kda [Plakobranchus ocellatus]|uniref:Centrosomal protein of 120 kDa n=1 Tax=Plakobranchus ocellatus TaxID=259542 RepID=A0AAV4CWG9_9GAST|nr:centrosomal protein of 120 kda [Plakobranchus ocellatus]